MSTLTGHELGDGTHFTYAFHPGGRFTGVDMGREVRGTWRVDGDEVCWIRVKPKGNEECMSLRRRGRHVQLMRDGILFFEGTLSDQR